MTEVEYDLAYKRVESRAATLQMVEDDLVETIKDNEDLLNDFWIYKGRIQSFYDAKTAICENQVNDLIAIVESQANALEKLQFSFDEMTMQLLRVDRENKTLSMGLLMLAGKQGITSTPN
jgi:hypothetical protein